MRAHTLCAVWGCREFATREGRCELHRRRSPKAWRRVARQVIARARGRCERCGSRAPLTAHHVRPLVLGGHEIVSADEVLALCASCQGVERPANEVKPS